MRYNIIDQIFQLKSVCISKEENIRNELGLSPAEFGVLWLWYRVRIFLAVYCHVKWGYQFQEEAE